MSGQKIIKGLEDAVAGNFSRVVIDGQVWVRRDAYDDMLAALKLARRSMIVSATGISDGLTIHDIRRWIEQADAAITKAQGKTP